MAQPSGTIWSEAIHEASGKFSFFAFGDDESYVFDAGGTVNWRGIPRRMEELIHSRNQFNMVWAALGHRGAYFLLFSDGKYCWGGCVHCESAAGLRPLLLGFNIQDFKEFETSL